MRPLVRLLSVLVLMWAVLSAPVSAASAAARAQAVITFDLPSTSQQIYTFASRNGRLYVHYWDGAVWRWADQGAPPAASLASAPAAISYLQGSVQRIYAFVVGSDGHLYVNYWDGSGWSWADQGAPAGVSLTGTPDAISFDGAGGQRIYVFVRGQNGRLYVNLWNGSGWSWSDHGPPPSTSLVDTPDVITYRESSDQPQQIYAFARGQNGRLYVNYLANGVWRWADQGTPPDSLTGGPVGAITYREGSLPQRIYAFVRGQNGHLYVNYWDGGTWTWADQGLPPGTATSGAPGVISFNSYAPGSTLIYAFVRGQNGRLYVNYWNGSTWTWADQGAPIFTTVSSSPDVITYREGILPQRILAFVWATNNQLYLNQWDGSGWVWDNRGAP